MLDLGNVIIPVDFSRCHSALARVCRIPPEEIPHRIRASGLVDRFETGELSPENFVREVSAMLQMNLSMAGFWEIWSLIFVADTLIPESMLESLARERQLLLLSNTNAIHFPMCLQKYTLLRHFHKFVLSYEVGALKPSMAIYQEAIARSGCRPEECFFADDIAENVTAARCQGIDAVQFHSLEQLERDLRQRGITWS